jgi:aldehyde dehydrogenase (NAD+)
MEQINQVYIDGAFVAPHGSERFAIINPATEQAIGSVILGDADDTRLAIAAARRAFPTFARTTKTARLAMLHDLHAAVLARAADLRAATVLEYGAPVARAEWVAQYAAQSFLDAAQTLADYDFTRRMGSATVVMEPVGVAGLITPWNSTAGSICSKLAMAIAAGCTSVIKPSEMSALQAQVVTEALHAAGLPPGVFNVVTGRGDIVGGELSRHPDVARLSFTGSTAVGKLILKSAADTMKRVTLALSAKSPTLILDDADLATAIPLAIDAAFLNNGQACIAGARLLVPAGRRAEIIALVRARLAATRVGDPNDPATAMGPLASRDQFERVQGFIRSGIEAGATLVAGGAGKPAGLEQGYFVRPTVFADVRPDMAIAREEIFGPVLSILSYDTEAEAIDMANDSLYGLQAYVFSRDLDHASAVAAQLQAGRVCINGFQHDPLAPFGGFKQSGLGREFGVFGLESFLEAKAIIGLPATPVIR